MIRLSISIKRTLQIFAGVACVGWNVCSLEVSKIWAAEPSLYELNATWKDESNSNVSFKQWKGRKTILSMFYVKCNKTCMMTMKKLTELQAYLDQKKLSYEVILVTLDPEEDLPESLASYRKRHHLNYRNWHLLTGSKESIAKLAKTFKFENWRMDDHILHDFRVLLLDEMGQVLKVAEDWHTDLTRLVVQ